MTSGVLVRDATEADILAVKGIVDSYRQELGFVPLPALRTAQARNCLLVAEIESEVIGMLDWWQRRDCVMVVYNIAVYEHVRRRGAGQLLLLHLIERAKSQGVHQIRLKCPSDLASNSFYAHEGFVLKDTEPGKKRPLNCWELNIDKPV